MRRDLFLFTNLDQNGIPNFIPSDSNFGLSLLSQFSSLMDTSLKRPKSFYYSKTLALQNSFNRLNKVAGALFVWLSRETSSNLSHVRSRVIPLSQIRNCIERLSKDGHAMQEIITRFANMTISRVLSEAARNPNYGVLSLASVVIPPFDNIASKVLAESVPFASFEEKCRVCANIPISDITWSKDSVEPKTGIKFPALLEDNLNYATELLVGTGSKSMTIIFKSLNVYAFGLYIHPDSVCEKLGPKYSSVPAGELKNNPDFFNDLLREDIHMTVRLVVNCNGLSISRVRDTFEKSLRFRLERMNPNTDYNCLDKFGSYFSQDIRIPLGTTIDFRRTTQGQLITEIDGRHIGAVHSKDLCKAFFDMYVGEIPVSFEAKQEIANNVGGIIKRC
ncbi:hypothetical protein LUZ60_000960 [Juncus effusus]|nr:hypothetical protein LUZ60_000960 [Juncus effusus]